MLALSLKICIFWCLSVLNALIKKAKKPKLEAKKRRTKQTNEKNRTLKHKRLADISNALREAINKNNYHRRWAEKNMGQWGRCKISFLLFNLAEAEAGNQPINELEHRAQPEDIFILEGQAYTQAQTDSNPISGQRGAKGSLAKEEDQISAIHHGQSDQRCSNKWGCVRRWLCTFLL